MVENVRWGILGTSAIATKRVIPAMQQSALVTVLGIASRDLDKARWTADAAGIARAYGSYEALLADPEIEAVYIPRPNTLHLEWSLKALERGKHVLCEKPLAMNAAEAEVLAQAAARSGLVVEEGFAFVNHPQWDFLQATIASRQIGTVRSVHVLLAYNNFNPADLRNNPAEGGGALYDIGCYAIKACRLIFKDEPIRVTGLFDMDPNFGTDRLTSALLQFPQGHGTITVSTQAGPDTGGTHQQLGILGSRGWLSADFPFSHSTPSACHVALGDGSALGGLPTRVYPFPVVNQYQLQAERFSRLVRGLPARAWPLSHAEGNMRVLDALFRSQASKSWEMVSLPA